MKTTIELTFTNITFYNAETGQAETTKTQGKLTNKECKDFLSDGCRFIMKEVENETFEVYTDELLKLRIEEN